MNQNKSKKNDFLLAGIILVAAFAFLLFQNLVMRTEGETVTITQDGKTVGQYSLKENQTIPLKQENGYNLLVIEEGSASMKEADCPDMLCVKQRKISRPGESLICLPHKLIVTVDGNKNATEPGLDSVAY